MRRSLACLKLQNDLAPRRVSRGNMPAFSHRALLILLGLPWLAIASDEAAATRCAKALDAHATYYDDERREYVVVAPAGARLTTATGACESSLRVEISPLTRALAAEIQREVTAREFHPEARKHTYAAWLNPRSGRMVIHSDAPARVLAALKNKYGSLVEFQEGGVVLK